MFRHLLNVIEKVMEGKIRDRDGNVYRYVGFLVTEDEFEKYKKYACEAAAEYVEDILWEEGIPEEERKKIVKQVESCLLSPYEALERCGIEDLDYYPPPIEDLQAEFVLEDALRRVEGAPKDAQASEEPAFGLPEFSLYWGADVRSYTGRWSYPDAYTDICWYLIADEHTCQHIKEAERALRIMAEEKREKTKKPYKWLFAVWKELRWK